MHSRGRRAGVGQAPREETAAITERSTAANARGFGRPHLEGCVDEAVSMGANFDRRSITAAGPGFGCGSQLFRPGPFLGASRKTESGEYFTASKR